MASGEPLPAPVAACSTCCRIYSSSFKLDPNGRNSIHYFRAVTLTVTAVTLIIATILVGRQQKRRPEINSFQRKLLLITIGVVVLHMIGGILPITMGSIVMAYGYSNDIPWYLFFIASCITGATWTIACFICYMFYITPHRTSFLKLFIPSLVIFIVISTAHFLGSEFGRNQHIWFGYLGVEVFLLPLFVFCFINSLKPLFCLYPRPVLRYWSAYLIVMHSLFLTGYILIDQQKPSQYCSAIVQEIFFATTFALVIYYVLYKDGEYLAEETTPLLALYKEGALNLIPWEDLVVEDDIKGAGSHGSVYKAYWGSETVAVKKIMLSEDGSSFGLFGSSSTQSWSSSRVNNISIKYSHESQEAITALAREASYLVELRHPSIVQFYGITQIPSNSGTERFAIITKYMEHNLFSVIQEQVTAQATPIAWPTRLKWIRDLAFGLKYLHSKGINHGDIKSMNVLLSADLQTCQICDFGSAGRRATATQHTPQWSAPEVLNGYPYTKASDVYAFGVLVWEIVTFHHPYERLSVNDAKEAIKAGKTPLVLWPQYTPSDIPLVCLKIMEACLNVSANRRPTMDKICVLLSPNKIDQDWQILTNSVEESDDENVPLDGGIGSEYV